MGNNMPQCKIYDKKKPMAENTQVSIITPVLNGAKYLEVCIQSVLNQSYPYIEHIFVDGCSTDGTLDILQSYKTKYPDRIKFISEPDEGGRYAINGAIAATNKGWMMARGDILGWLGADDTYEPDAIQTVVEFFRSNLNAYFVFGDGNHINEKGNIIKKISSKDFDLDEAINNNYFIMWSSAFYRREVIEKVGFQDTSINAADFDFQIRAGKVFKMHRIKKTLANFRRHKDSTSCSKEAYSMFAREGFIICRKHGGSIFSLRARTYYRCLMIDFLRPLTPVYPFIQRLVPTPIKRVIAKILGMYNYGK